MKFLASIVVVILLICGGALWFLANGSVNTFVKEQMETVGTELTDQKVTVNTVDIKLLEGAGSILGVNIANPKNYTAPHAFSLGEVTLDINIESLTKEPIVIDAIVIKDPKAFVQFTKEGKANLKDILDAINANLPKDGAEKPQQGDAPKAPLPKLSISKVVLAGTALTVDLSALGNKEHQATLPDIILTDIGGKEGLPADQLGGAVMKEALSAIWKETKKTQKAQLLEEGKNKLIDKAKKKLTDLFG